MFVLILDREALIKDVDVGQKQGDIRVQCTWRAEVVCTHRALTEYAESN